MHVAERLRQLAQHHPDAQIAELLNAEGFLTATGLIWTVERVWAVRRRHTIPTACPVAAAAPGPRGDGLVKSGEAARCLGVHPCMIAQWFQQGLLSGYQRKPGGWLWIRLAEEDLFRLDGSAPWQPEMTPLVGAEKRLGMTANQLYDTIRSGSLTAFRLNQEGAWRWYLLPANNNPISRDC